MFVQKLKAIVASPKFFYGLLAFIILSCVLFAVSITYKIPPDEYYHFRFIEFYANQPLRHGPFISNQGTEYFDLRDITRIPNYLYHYAMSFPLRGLRVVTDSLFEQVLALRLITLGIGVASIFVIRRILGQLKASPFMQNSVIFLFGLTGMQLWIMASINYDVPSILLYLVCVSVALSIVQGKGITSRRVLLFSLFAMLCVMTKVTFVPFLGLLVLFTVILKRKDLRFIQDLHVKNLKHAGLIVAFVLIGMLFVERIGMNVIRYHQIEVTCNKVHTYEQCMEDDVFSRNENQLRAYAAQKAAGQGVDYHPYQFTQMWLTFMYERSHFYYGHQQMTANYGAKVFAVITGLIMTVLALIFRRRIAETPGEKLLFLITASYAAVLYIFNLQTYLKYGQPYAFQGRYFFPVVAFLFYFVIKLLILTYRSLGKKPRQVFAAVVLCFVMLSIYTHLPLLVFYRGTEAKWYSDPTKDFNLTVQDGLRKINIKTLY